MFSIFTILKVFADYSRERKKEEDNLFLQIWSEFVDNPFSIKLKLPTGFRDDMKMAFANTFLISQGYPAINQRKLVSSTIKLIEKLTETFTSYEVDFRQYEKTIKYKPTSIQQFYIFDNIFIWLVIWTRGSRPLLRGPQVLPEEYKFWVKFWMIHLRAKQEGR